MKQFDFAKLKEINDLDFEQIAIWPFEVKTVVALFIVIVVSAISYCNGGSCAQQVWKSPHLELVPHLECSAHAL